ncbi:hypothetical protein KDA_13870 [Dictyobacter alpinus]|uniref:Uncharacterized protein n=1 Tax=Dictyobacter alpinus TaxID=2014873 RepID=A0A402B3I6_9CHLR|nr:hypothetical protein KDA_13870 [Dictyobacter alpinus]
MKNLSLIFAIIGTVADAIALILIILLFFARKYFTTSLVLEFIGLIILLICLVSFIRYKVHKKS